MKENAPHEGATKNSRVEKGAQGGGKNPLRKKAGEKSKVKKTSEEAGSGPGLNPKKAIQKEGV